MGDLVCIVVVEKNKQKGEKKKPEKKKRENFGKMNLSLSRLVTYSPHYIFFFFLKNSWNVWTYPLPFPNFFFSMFFTFFCFTEKFFIG